MAKNYILDIENGYCIYELEGKKKRKNPIFIDSQFTYSQTFLYQWFLHQIRTFEWQERNESEILRLKEYIPERIKFIMSMPYFLDKGVIYTSHSLVGIQEVKDMLSWYHKIKGKGTYHLWDTHHKSLIKRGQPTNELHSKMVFSYSSAQYIQLIKEWDKEVGWYFSEEEWGEIAWILMDCRLKGRYDIPHWMEKKYEDRVLYFPYFLKKEIEMYVYYKMIVTFQQKKNNK